MTSIGGSAFKGCSGLTSVTIGNSVTSIGADAFGGCSGLTNVTIPNSVTSIGGYAFNGCSGLTNVTIPNSVTSIGKYAFSGTAWYDNQPDGVVYAGKVAYTYKGSMPSNAEIVIQDGTLGIADNAFYRCSGMTSVTIPNSVTSIGYQAFYGCTPLTNVSIGNSVTTIGNEAFRGCSGLKSVTIGNSVTSIGSSAFRGCSGLTSIIIPNSVTSISSSAFYYCSGLTSVTIGDSVTSIGGDVFYGCSGLTSVTIGNSVTSIGSRAFYGCSGLTSATIPNSVTSIGKEAFNGCSGLTNVTIGDSVTSIGNSAFYGCSGLTSVTIPNSLTYIDASTFSGCSGLTSVTIPKSVTSIGNYAFGYCSSLTSVTVENETPVDIDYYTFTNRKYATLYVPLGSKPAYKVAKYWKEFKEIIEIEESNYMLGDINGDGTVDVSDYIGVANRILNIGQEGFNELASDVNEDGIIDVSDYLGIGNIIHTGSPFGNSNASRGAKKVPTDITTVDNIIYVAPASTAVGDTTTTLSLCMKNSAEIRGFQFDLYLPEGVTVNESSQGKIQGVKLNENRLPEDDEHTLTCSIQQDGAIRFLCGSQYQETFTGNDGEIITLQVNISKTVQEGDFPIILRQMKLSENDISKSYETEYVESTLNIVTAGINIINSEAVTDNRYYNLNGQKLTNPVKGINIINGQKVVIK